MPRRLNIPKRGRKSITIDSTADVKKAIEEIIKTAIEEGKEIEVKGKNEEAKGLIYLLSGIHELSPVKYKATKDGGIFLPTHHHASRGGLLSYGWK